ncbi:hypothetical protein SLITO_v1c10530 [Spiroplasma litorale]|uniref:DUF4064 domain-containing protein n=1 Tax=Spiroplasma litorale TaxID=216942 RepID=A0A0K1W2W4_9MOLU|nr:hypothetical protein [Spiroplasma litorale]AKX34664.1 hypothetical protein SLITO_v1c10530 [Spiroplasma litorale]
MDKKVKGGIITSIVGASICCVIGIFVFLIGTVTVTLFANLGTVIITIIGALLLIGPTFVIIFGSLALVKNSNNFKIVCAIFSLLCIVVGWMAYFIPVVLFSLGGVLMLCGKIAK